MALTEKQKRFVAEYLVDLNATQAAIRAGYSERTAGQIGEQNLKKLEIQEALQKAMKNREARTEITQDKVLNELGKVAFSEAADYAESKLKYSSKLRALEMLGKHLGLFDGKGGQSVDHANNLLDAIRQSGEVNTDEIPEAE